jgi:hypothetical protein
MVGLQAWCQVAVVDRDGTPLVCCILGGKGVPDLGAVDQVARLLLTAKRLGGSIVLGDTSPALWALLELAGLDVEVERQAELGKEPFAVQQGQEEVHGDNLPL